jgi:hypothetical protein
VLDKLANKLAYWKARILTKDGRVAYVQAIMTASVIFQLLALDVDPWFIDVVDWLRRGFLWAGKTDVRGGCYLVCWCSPRLHLFFPLTRSSRTEVEEEGYTAFFWPAHGAPPWAHQHPNIFPFSWLNLQQAAHRSFIQSTHART